ncbi:MAG: sel1 repeat family protein [Gammaproteobacteria bacterium]|nr:sel1 repeat family protein [Gammaproteobacteria bacterium]
MRYITIILLLMLSQTVLANKCVDLMQKEEFYEASDVCSSMAKKGDRNAQFALGVMYYQGSGMMSDFGQAQKWIRKAAEQNHKQGQYNLGIMLANGQGSPADLVEAYAWLKISAENGYSAAADSVKQLSEELSSGEKKAAEKRINSLKKEFKLN